MVSAYSERELQERASRIHAAAVGAISRDRGAAEPPSQCYRCGATEGLITHDICRGCFLAVDAVLKPLPEGERAERVDQAREQ